MIVDCATYRAGAREDTAPDADTLRETLASLSDGEFIWIGLANPRSDEMHRIGEALSLHPLAVEDALEAHQRPKFERYSDHLFASLRAVTYSDDDIRTHEVNVFLGQHFLLTVRHGGGSLHEARRRAEALGDKLTHGPTAAFHAVVDTIVDRYEDVAAELEQDVEEVESSVFSPAASNDSTRIYRLKRETLEFRRAVQPLREPMQRFAQVALPEESRPYFRDIGDHLARAAEAIDTIDHLLDNALQAHLAQLSVRQNEDMRKLAAGATIFAIPTAIAGIYGMNFEHMPELTWTYGYPACLALMAGLCLYVMKRFRASGWL